jgi:sugar/nucleoside kinase (ribokinase family)
LNPTDRRRRGVCCAGNWIIDHVKTINAWPAEETLATIVAEDLGTGGAAYNVSVDLARFDLGVPLWGLGLVGDDADGARILEDARRCGIDRRHLRPVPDARTAYTDVMTIRGTGKRTFFHHRGASALLAPEHFPVADLECRILCLGYLLLLDALDAEDQAFGTAAARVLAACRAAGILTAVDLVSEDSDRFDRVVTPALPHTDYLIVNEIEAGRTTGGVTRSAGVLDQGAVRTAAETLLERGVGRMVVVHAPEGAFACSRAGERLWKPSLDLPPDSIRGAAGAGDAFFAGVIAGIHEDWDLDDTLGFAHAAAASCLRHPTCTGGIGSAKEIREIAAALAPAPGPAPGPTPEE